MTTQAQTAAHAQAVVLDVHEQTFGRDVLVRSQDVPVVVDFWAPWCGPCRTLGPTLEKLAHEGNGSFVLAKINVDENQGLASTYQVQGIPAVKAFRDGKVVNEFTGAQPETQIRAWLKQVVPSAVDLLAEEAASLVDHDPQGAAARYRQALEADPDHGPSLVGLGQLLLAQGDQTGAEMLRRIPAGTPLYPRAQVLLGLADFFASATTTDANALTAHVASTPTDTEARYQLAAHLAHQERYEDAMQHLLTIVMRDRAFRDDGARRALLALFESLGEEHPLVAQYRRNLANALF